METVDRHAQHVALTRDDGGQLVGDHRLAGAVDAIDRHGRTSIRPKRDDAIGEGAHSGIPLGCEEALGHVS